MTPRLQLSGITKRFPGVVANEAVSFSVAPGEIHALLGVQKADEGTIAFDGQSVSIASPKEARALGIGMVFQHFSLFEAMTVLENIALGMDHPPPRRELESKVREVLKTYDLALDPHRDVHTLSVGERQRILVHQLPERAQIDVPLTEQLIVELYSK